jgi:hypothetical protein
VRAVTRVVVLGLYTIAFAVLAVTTSMRRDV